MKENQKSIEEDELPEWMKKCIRCKHSYEKQNDDGTIHCRIRTGECKYEEYINKEKKTCLKI